MTKSRPGAVRRRFRYGWGPSSTLSAVLAFRVLWLISEAEPPDLLAEHSGRPAT
ncbi:hypothetical protein [Streptomyces canus]|uniref:hypothetical protein n=1 Tax=Streptomyces canus TaxID=58343 RepID=UPI002DD7C4DC|nr:hypothetical protein [Streptomyces canus]WSD92736.1 hypothetical protein OG925_51740 [Streptomyces canus]